MYGKLFESMYDGTLVENWEALVTFQQMIILCDSEGIIDKTSRAISARTGIPIKVIENGIKLLEKEDPQSRTKTMNGVRIERIDNHREWGWKIVNHEKYKKMQNYEDKKASDRERMRMKRSSEKLNKNKGVAKCRKVSQSVADVAYTNTNTNTNKGKPLSFSFEDIWKRYPNNDGKKEASRHFNATVKTEKDWVDINSALKKYLSSDKVISGFIKNGSTWFNNWRDWVDWVEPKQNGSRPKEGDTNWNKNEWLIFKSGEWVPDTGRFVI